MHLTHVCDLERAPPTFSLCIYKIPAANPTTLIGERMYSRVYGKPSFAGQQNHRRESSTTSLGSNPQSHQVITSPSSGRPQSTVKVTKNEVSDNHPDRCWGIAQVLAVKPAGFGQLEECSWRAGLSFIISLPIISSP